MKEVLIVEDNRINQIVASRILTGLGMRVNLASNGYEAISAIKAHRYDLVFMDFHMPEMDGCTAASEIRKLEHEKKIRKLPIIALTANNTQANIEVCKLAGMDDYLSKPVTEQAFANMLRKWLGAAEVLDTQTTINVNPYKYLSLKDLEKLFKIMGLGFFGLMEMYFSSIDDLLSDLEIAIIEEDYLDIIHTAHTIRAPSLQVGSVQVEAKAYEIEELAKEQGSFSDIFLKFAILREQVTEANIELRQYISTKNKVA